LVVSPNSRYTAPGSSKISYLGKEKENKKEKRRKREGKERKRENQGLK
jgi:hypothetical protein